MFKTIGKIIVILLVAALVAGGVYALVQAGSANDTTVSPRDQFKSRETNGTFVPPDGFREHDSEGEFSLGRGLGGLLVTLLKVGVITLIITQLQRVLSKVPRPTIPGSA